MTTTDRTTADRLIRQHMPAADAIGRQFARRFAGLVELDDMQQEARYALCRAAARVTDPATAAGFLRACIKGHLAHYLRDRVRLVRVSRRAHETGTVPLGHDSLNAIRPGTGRAWLDDLAAPEADASTEAVDMTALLDRMPAADAAVLRLRFVEGLSVRAAAERLGVSRATAHRQERRAIDTARALLAV